MITLSQFLEVQSIYSKDISEGLKIEQIQSIIGNQVLPRYEDIKPSNTIYIKGEKYSINPVNKLKTGEYVDAEQSINNLPLLLAILCRKDNEPYDEDFQSQIEDRVNLFKSIPVEEAFKLVNFLLALESFYLIRSQRYLEIKESLNQSLKHIGRSLRLGVLKKPSLILQIPTYLKLKRLIKSI